MIARHKGKYTCAEIDRILAEAEKTKADVDYIAMMTDVEIDPEEETEVADNEQEIPES